MILFLSEDEILVSIIFHEIFYKILNPSFSMFSKLRFKILQLDIF